MTENDWAAAQHGDVHLHLHVEAIDRAEPGSLMVLRVPEGLTDDLAAQIKDALDRAMPAVGVLIVDESIQLTLVPPGAVQQALIAGAERVGAQGDTPGDGPTAGDPPGTPGRSASAKPAGQAAGCGCRCSCGHQSMDLGCGVHGSRELHLRYGRQGSHREAVSPGAGDATGRVGAESGPDSDRASLLSEHPSERPHAGSGGRSPRAGDQARPTPGSEPRASRAWGDADRELDCASCGGTAIRCEDAVEDGGDQCCVECDHDPGRAS